MSSLADLLLSLTALSGELPAALVSRLPGTVAYQNKVVKALKKEGLLLVYSRNGLRGLRLTLCAKKRLREDCSEWLLPYLSGAAETNRLKSDVARRLRLHRMAEVLVTMLNANVSVLPWEKPALFSPVPPAEQWTLKRPAYYSSREVKELGEQAIKIRGSRSTGVLLTPHIPTGAAARCSSGTRRMDGNIFVIYNTGPGQMKWEYKAEMRVKALLEMELCQARLPAQFGQARQSAIVFAADMEQMPPLMGVGEDGRHNYFVLDGNFEHFYYLTSDHHGEVILQMLCRPDEKAVLDGILSEGYDPPRPGWVVENDAMEDETPVLYAYTCDMPRIKHFDTALTIHGLAGTLYCFDFQENAIRRVCGPRVAIRCIDFEAYERSVFLSPENS